MTGAIRPLPSQPLSLRAAKPASGGKNRAHRVAPPRTSHNPLQRLRKTHLCGQTRVGAHILGQTIGNALAYQISQGSNSASQAQQAPGAGQAAQSDYLSGKLDSGNQAYQYNADGTKAALYADANGNPTTTNTGTPYLINETVPSGDVAPTNPQAGGGGGSLFGSMASGSILGVPLGGGGTGLGGQSAGFMAASSGGNAGYVGMGVEGGLAAISADTPDISETAPGQDPIGNIISTDQAFNAAFADIGNPTPIATLAAGSDQPGYVTSLCPPGVRPLYLSNDDIWDLTKLVQTEYSPRAGVSQAYAVEDMVLNRLASDRFSSGIWGGNTIADVANKYLQFSGISGQPAWDGTEGMPPHNTVDGIPDSWVRPNVSALVSGYLQDRANGAPSIIGTSLNFANIVGSSSKNIYWIQSLTGGTFGKYPVQMTFGTASWYNKYSPPPYCVILPRR